MTCVRFRPFWKRLLRTYTWDSHAAQLPTDMNIFVSWMAIFSCSPPKCYQHRVPYRIIHCLCLIISTNLTFNRMFVFILRLKSHSSWLYYLLGDFWGQLVALDFFGAWDRVSEQKHITLLRFYSSRIICGKVVISLLNGTNCKLWHIFALYISNRPFITASLLNPYDYKHN